MSIKSTQALTVIAVALCIVVVFVVLQLLLGNTAIDIHLHDTYIDLR